MTSIMELSKSSLHSSLSQPRSNSFIWQVNKKGRLEIQIRLEVQFDFNYLNWTSNRISKESMGGNFGIDFTKGSTISDIIAIPFEKWRWGWVEWTAGKYITSSEASFIETQLAITTFMPSILVEIDFFVPTSIDMAIIDNLNQWHFVVWKGDVSHIELIWPMDTPPETTMRKITVFDDNSIWIKNLWTISSEIRTIVAVKNGLIFRDRWEANWTTLECIWCYFEDYICSQLQVFLTICWFWIVFTSISGFLWNMLEDM